MKTIPALNKRSVKAKLDSNPDLFRQINSLYNPEPILTYEAQERISLEFWSRNEKRAGFKLELPKQGLRELCIAQI